jgi:hypothetical protein
MCSINHSLARWMDDMDLGGLQRAEGLQRVHEEAGRIQRRCRSVPLFLRRPSFAHDTRAILSSKRVSICCGADGKQGSAAAAAAAASMSSGAAKPSVSAKPATGADEYDAHALPACSFDLCVWPHLSSTSFMICVSVCLRV